MLRFYLWVLLYTILLAACSGSENVESDNGALEEPAVVNENTSSLGDWDVHPSLLFRPPINSTYSTEGDVVLRIHTSAEGTVDTVWIIESSMHMELDSLAIEHASGMVFKPAMKSGKPIPAQFYFPVSFRLR